GLSFSRVRALKRLQDEPRTLRDLADEMGIDAPAATVLVNDLEARGLAKRHAHPENRRAKLVSLTKEGTRILAKLGEIDDPPPPAFASLPAVQVDALRRVLSKVDPE
ncbi:MAG TPA: MarR family transcriptional regulator, partial [Nevskiaceae bacterium]|nr:MarR family transcriptional regulator [Nevskiaceae bacterium]